MSKKIAVFDIETLDISSQSLILSAAILFVDIEADNFSIQQLRDDVCYVKFLVEDQIKNYKRTIDPETSAWWKKQCKIVKEVSLIPSKIDVPAKEGIQKMIAFVKENCDPKNTPVFIRGSLDQLAFDSLTKQTGLEMMFPYNVYRDARTFVECMADESVRGYCEVSKEIFKDYDRQGIIKHDVRDDVVLDAAMIISCLR